MNDMRKLMEAVKLNEYYINNTATWGDALQTISGVYGDDVKHEKQEFKNDGWLRAADVLKTLERFHKEIETQLKKAGLFDKVVPERFVDELDMAATGAWDHIDMPGDGSEEDYIELNIQERLNGMEMLSNMAEDLEEPIIEAYDEEVDGPGPSNIPEQALYDLVRELQKLERNTARVFNELRQSKGREDFAALVLNEFSMTLTEISDLVEKYEDY